MDAGVRRGARSPAGRGVQANDRCRAQEDGAFRKPFLLMLLETGEYQSGEKNGKVLADVISALLPATRETDVVGWYKNSRSVGVMFTDLVMFDQKSILSAMLRGWAAPARHLTLEQFNQVTISFHFFPDNWDDDTPAAEQSDAVP